MVKKQVESIYCSCMADINQTNGTIKALKKLYKEATTEANIFYNNILDTIINTKITELSYSDGSGAIYI